MDTHNPWITTPEFNRWQEKPYTGEAIKQGNPVTPGSEAHDFTDEDVAYFRNIYDACVLQADAGIGLLLEELNSCGLLESTVVLVSSDHGENLADDGKHWGHGDTNTTDEVMRTPLLIAGPGLPKGQQISSLTQLTDIVPTLVDLLAVKTEAAFDGSSLLPLLEDPSAPPLHACIPAKAKYDRTAGPIWFARNSDFKYDWDPATGEEHLWRAPDSITNRTDVLGSLRQSADELCAYLKTQVAPLWKESCTDGRASMLVLSYGASAISPAEAVEVYNPDGPPKDLHHDGKWCFGGNQLWSRGPDEDCPPVTLDLIVPNGKYRAQVELLSEPNHHGTGIPASSLLIRSQGETDFKQVTADGDPGERPPRVFVDFGTYEVDRHRFVVTLDDVRSHFAFARFFRLLSDVEGVDELVNSLEAVQATGEPSNSSEDVKEREEKLETLGYL